MLEEGYILSLFSKIMDALMKKNSVFKKKKKFNIDLLPNRQRSLLGLKKKAFKGNTSFSIWNNIIFFFILKNFSCFILVFLGFGRKTLPSKPFYNNWKRKNALERMLFFKSLLNNVYIRKKNKLPIEENVV